MFQIHELTADDGSLLSVYLAWTSEDASLHLGGEVLPLPPGAIPFVLCRLGRPLDPDATLREIARWEVGDERLRHVRHKARYDVIARDFLAYQGPATESEEVAALAPSVAGAWMHLARTFAARDQATGE